MNSTVLESGPGPIFSTSIRIAINQLNNVTISIHKVFHLGHPSFEYPLTPLSQPGSNNSLVGPSLSKCQTWVNDSLSRLNESLTVLSVDSDIESLTYEEMDNMKTRNVAATGNVVKCLLELEDVIDVMVDGEEKMGVEEVKLGVEKARKYMVPDNNENPDGFTAKLTHRDSDRIYARRNAYGLS
ncbi:hypothetical protein DH2020_048299 [Rehmannia glutinosa]|uniref:Uncharacterized protein n=1 Tax=Rehmannia glutinosa TaxID=99300 RepID=A0ABR0U6D3_REHGL